ncbi:MAG: GYD domain-containing protein, partial [Nitrospinaceae bacterium]|nr:GYD domain-containing protein [Nitrospinaceae bacterium]NIT80710.1 GYD domain-containing protein [Nitrospinaceae bacterium]NIU95104.1 GYD domain-containing protein [Nitrospinaceae bacterium]NIY13736.1 GYD domain-containing protein [Nitrospinaceae bacterium]
FKETAREHGVHIREVLWIMGNYDICAIAEAADDQTACSLLLKVGAWGNVRSTTYRAFDREEMVNMVKRLE